MAGGPNGAVFSERDNFPNFRDLEDTVSHILYGVLHEGRNKVVDVLSVDIERDLLVETRDLLFRHAVERYKGQLREANIHEQPDLSAKRRTGEKAMTSLSGDIVDLYLFAGGFVDVFPKTVLGNAGKYIDFKASVATGQKDTGEQDVVKTQRRLAELASKLSEQGDKVKDMQKDIVGMKENYEGKIRALRETIGNMERELNSVKAEVGALKGDRSVVHGPTGMCTHVKMPIIIGCQTSSEQITESANHQTATAQATVGNQRGTAQTTTAAAGGEQAVNGQQSKTVTSNSKAAAEQQSTGVHHTGALRQRTQPRQQQGAPVVPHSPEINSFQQFPSLPKSTNNGDSPALKTPGDGQGHEWTQVTRSRRGSKNTGGASRQSNGSTRASASSLRGVKREKTTTLYVKNVALNEDESDDELKGRLKRFIKQRTQVRVISVQVVHNRFCEDTVGCKMTVPWSAQEILMQESFWPEDVECREWQRHKPKQARGQRQLRHGTDDERDSRYDGRDEGPSGSDDYDNERFHGNDDAFLWDGFGGDAREHQLNYSDGY